MAYVKCIRNLISSTVPDGKTVTPTDDISIWLACGGRSETYTTLSQVLADVACLSALINSNNAVDYLVRSTTWTSGITADSSAMSYIGLNNYAANTLLADSTWCTAICNSTYFESVLNVKVPVMTSNTTPEGECFGSPTYASDPAWKAFDGTTSNQAAYSSNSDATIGYGFTDDRKIFMAVSDSHAKYCAYHYSDDKATWNLIHAYIQYSTRQKKFIFPTPVTSRYFRILMNDSIHSDGTTLRVYTCQFYGREGV